MTTSPVMVRCDVPICVQVDGRGRSVSEPLWSPSGSAAWRPLAPQARTSGAAAESDSVLLPWVLKPYRAKVVVIEPFLAVRRWGAKRPSRAWTVFLCLRGRQLSNPLFLLGVLLQGR
jgi:hypothetical protein